MSLFEPPAVVPTDGTIRIVSVGRLVQSKGFDTLIRAFARIAESDSRLQLVIAGAGEMDEELHRLRASLRVEKRVHFVGNLARREVATLMRQAHLFAHATRFESFGVVFVEAMAAGLPVVATNVGPVSEIVGPESGVLAADTDVEAVQTAMAAVVSRLESFDRRLISERVRQRYSYEHVSGMLERLYQQIIETAAAERRPKAGRSFRVAPESDRGMAPRVIEVTRGYLTLE